MHIVLERELITGTLHCRSKGIFCCHCIITVQTGYTQIILKGGDHNWPIFGDCAETELFG